MADLAGHHRQAVAPTANQTNKKAGLPLHRQK